MSLPSELETTLRATGFVIGETHAPGLSVRAMSDASGRFVPDAVWRDRSSVEVLFKFAPSAPEPAQIASWHRDAWNLGVAPLLWIVSPQKIELYNTFRRPDPSGSASAHLLRTFERVETELARLDEYAGRLSMVSGRFWTNEKRVDRAGRVDQQLLRDLQDVESQLQNDGLDRHIAQALLGRTIFIRYLTDRGIVTPTMLSEFGSESLDVILGNRESTYALFDWVKETFNGDLFPVDGPERRNVRVRHLQLVSRTLAGVSPLTGQGSLWPYKFDIIPIELISSIYEQFAHQVNADEAQDDGLHYTPVSVVNLVLDEVLRDIKPDARILDITCGSGVFLVEALRRLVRIKAGKAAPTRQVIRKTIKDQIFGVDKNDAAIRVASFSLYLTALELDPDPRPPKALRFDPLIGRNLFISDAFELANNADTRALCGMRFDAIVGNPPWTYSGRDRKPTWQGPPPPLPPRSKDFAFVWRSLDLAHEQTRFGMVMRATPFFSTAKASCRARNALFDKLAPITLVNLAALRDDLFPNADYPAVVLFSRLYGQSDKMRAPIITVPWTAGFSRSGVFEVSPTDVRIVNTRDLKESAYGLKAVALGTSRDRLLLRQLTIKCRSLAQVIGELGLKSAATGVQLLEGDGNDATHLVGLPLLDSGELRANIDPRGLDRFNLRKIHRPRDRESFRGPLIIFGEGLRAGRIPVGFSKSDIVYSRSYYGVSFSSRKNEGQNLARCLAGILQSSLASWFLLLTASEFGVHKRKVLLQDIEALPVPSVERITSRSAEAVASAVQSIDESSKRALRTSLTRLDRAVFDLYEFEDHDRVVISEGLARAQCEYNGPRLESDLAINVGQLKDYALTFLDVVNAWSSALERGTYDAELLDVRAASALRIIRFVKGGTGQISKTEPAENINDVVERIGQRMRLPIAERLAVVRELRVHADGELFIIKPAARRFWTAAAGLNDADAALGDGLEVVAA
jgi:hypothetical protein